MKFHGLDISYFRSIGEAPVVLRPLKKVNIVVGQNNVGKSNILRAIQKLFIKLIPQGTDSSIEHLDLFNMSPNKAFTARLWFEIDGNDPDDAYVGTQTESKEVWFDILWPKGSQPRFPDCSFAHVTNPRRAQNLAAKLISYGLPSNLGTSQIHEEVAKLSERFFDRFRQVVPPVSLLQVFRQIQPGPTYDVSGSGIPRLLARYRSPLPGNEADRDKFYKIQEFVKSLLHLPSATLDFSPDDPDTIIIENEGLRLPITHYGTGMHELVILVTAVLSTDNSMWCIEEPEIHLHPHLQREFVDFLVNETNNTYILSTHSGAFINSVNDNIQVFHVERVNGTTVGGPAFTSVELIRAVRDLGLRASDLIQANCIVWVEGPSDQIYLRRWLELIEPNLIEGRDFLFMSYRELPKLSVDTETIANDLINVLHINRNAIFVVDSDKSKSEDELDEYTQAIVDKCEANGGLGRITDGREIENYVSPRVVAAVCKDLLRCEISPVIGPFDTFEEKVDDALREVGCPSLNYGKYKVRDAKRFSEQFTIDDMSEELKTWTMAIANKISEWKRE